MPLNIGEKVTQLCLLLGSNFPNDKIENEFTRSLFRETPVNWLILLLRFDPTE